MRNSKESEMSVHERLREAREASGLSQGQVAKKLNMHRPTISEIEAGRRKVSAADLENFSEMYGVSVGWLVSGPSADETGDARILMAARELSKMKEEDINRLMKMLQMLKKTEK